MLSQPWLVGARIVAPTVTTADSPVKFNPFQPTVTTTVTIKVTRTPAIRNGRLPAKRPRASRFAFGSAGACTGASLAGLPSHRPSI